MKLSLEKILFASMIILAPPAILLMIFGIFWLIFIRSDLFGPYIALAFFIIGIVIDLIYFKKWFEQRFKLPLIAPMSLFIFYNLLLFIIFKGFPVFNLILAPIMGYYVGLRNANQNLNQDEKDHLQTIIPFASAFVMLTFCTVSIFLAFSNSTLGQQIQALFNMENEISYTYIILISITGSFGLILSQFVLTRWTLKKQLDKV